jgi:hypothetical protein
LVEKCRKINERNIKEITYGMSLRYEKKRWNEVG